MTTVPRTSSAATAATPQTIGYVSPVWALSPLPSGAEGLEGTPVSGSVPEGCVPADVPLVTEEPLVSCASEPVVGTVEEALVVVSGVSGSSLPLIEQAVLSADFQHILLQIRLRQHRLKGKRLFRSQLIFVGIHDIGGARFIQVRPFFQE